MTVFEFKKNTSVLFYYLFIVQIIAFDIIYLIYHQTQDLLLLPYIYAVFAFILSIGMCGFSLPTVISGRRFYTKSCFFYEFIFLVIFANFFFIKNNSPSVVITKSAILIALMPFIPRICKRIIEKWSEGTQEHLFENVYPLITMSSGISLFNFIAMIVFTSLYQLDLELGAQTYLSAVKYFIAGIVVLCFLFMTHMRYKLINRFGTFSFKKYMVVSSVAYYLSIALIIAPAFIDIPIFFFAFLLLLPNQQVNKTLNDYFKEKA